MSIQPDDSAATLQLEYTSRTDVGRFRRHNEDALGEPLPAYAALVRERGYLFAVADGMGGHARGEVASQLTIDTLYDTYYNSAESDLAAALRDAVNAANQTVYYQAGVHGISMGSTLVAVVFHQHLLTLVNVGDSRIYRFRDGHVHQLTRDHSLVAERIRRGLITLEEAKVSPERNIITRSIGHRLPAEMDLARTPLQTGDIILLCSDGLHGVVEADELAEVIERAPVLEAPDRLIDLANQRGGPDNITCQVVRVVSSPGPPPEPATRPLDEETDT